MQKLWLKQVGWQIYSLTELFFAFKIIKTKFKMQFGLNLLIPAALGANLQNLGTYFQ